MLTASSTSWSLQCALAACHLSAFKGNLLEICEGTRTHLKSQSFPIIFFFSIIYFSATWPDFFKKCPAAVVIIIIIINNNPCLPAICFWLSHSRLRTGPILLVRTQVSAAKEWSPDRRGRVHALVPGALPGAFSSLILLMVLGEL